MHHNVCKCWQRPTSGLPLVHLAIELDDLSRTWRHGYAGMSFEELIIKLGYAESLDNYVPI